MNILIAGASGLVGTHLIPFLSSQGHTVKKLVRSHRQLASNEIAWDPSNGILNPKDLEGIDAVINLAGENIADSRWNENKKKKIRDSRVLSTKLLVKIFSEMERPPELLINASATGFYGSRGDEILTEESSNGTGFLAHVCREWEEAAEAANHAGMRVACLRFGVVWSLQGGALKKMLIPFRLGLGGVLGSGKQYMSWIAMDELLDIIALVLVQKSLKNAINAVTPNPVTNFEFTKTLGSILQRPTLLSVPEIALRVLLGEMADEMFLSSTRVIPAKLQKMNYQFKYPELKQALEHLLEK